MEPEFALASTFGGDAAGCFEALTRLSSIGYSESSVRDRLGLKDLGDLQLRALPIYRDERLQRREPLDSAIDLFLLQGELPASEMDRLLAPPVQEAMIRAGVLERSGAFIRTLVSLYPVGSTLIFSDHAWPQLRTGGEFSVLHDQVMYIGADSRWLSRATVRKPVASALDLCCGSGIHALLAAAHADRVTAVDVNPRAVRCTTFNAKAMRLSNLEALEGDLYAPVQGRRFDLITANPPFVPAPAQELGYRDGGPRGEDVQRRIVEGIPRHLAPGGMAQLVTELGEVNGETLESRLRQWLGGAAMDIHVLRLRIHPAHVYAIGHAGGEGHAAFLDSVGRWAANLRAQGFDRVSSVLIGFQWSEAPWSRVDEAHAPSRDAGTEVSEIFAAERTSRDPSLRDRLRSGRVARTGPVALVESRGLGTRVAPHIQATRLGMAMPMECSLEPLERDLLAAMDHSVTTAELNGVAGGNESAVLDALVSLVRKGFARLVP